MEVFKEFSLNFDVSFSVFAVSKPEPDKKYGIVKMEGDKRERVDSQLEKAMKRREKDRRMSSSPEGRKRKHRSRDRGHKKSKKHRRKSSSDEKSRKRR